LIIADISLAFGDTKKVVVRTIAPSPFHRQAHQGAPRLRGIPSVEACGANCQ
jgi:hypothetical protein